MTKKKTILAFVLSFMLFMPATFLLSSCGKHEHTFSTDWSTSGTQHWHKCTGEKCTEKGDLGDHDFVWTEKTPAGVHVDKVETGICSTCKLQRERTVEGSGIHTWVWKTNDTKHWQETTCEHETPLTQNEQDHTWEWKCDNVYDWEQTTCTQHDAKKISKTAHTWVYKSEGELTHQRQSNCGAEKHATRIDPNIPHSYDDVNDTTCNDCGFNRSPVGKGSFLGTFSAKTYNAGAQGIESNKYTVDEAIKDLCEIQYKVKGSNDSTYTATAPTNAGTYEVRIYCKGNSGGYLEGEVAKAEKDYVIKQIEVPVDTFFKLEKQTTSENYITLKTYKVTAGLPSNVTLTLRAYGEKYKNQGRYILSKNDAFEGLQFDNTNFKPIPTWNEQPQESVKIIVYTNETPVVTGTNQTAYNVWWMDKATPPYVILKNFTITSGTLQIGDYLICKGINVPLKLIDVELNINNITEQCSGIALAGETVNLRFAIEGFITKEIANTKLINTTFTKVDYEVLTFNEGANTTNSVDVTLQQNESMYLEFTATVSGAKTFKINFKSDGGYRAGESFKFYNAETGEQMTSSNDLVSVSGAGTYKIVIKITKVAAEHDYHNKTVSFSVTIQ